MKRGPLPDDFAIGAGIFYFVSSDTCKLVCGGITDAVAAGLNGVHFYLGQLGQNIWYISQCQPVELDILPGGQMAIAFVKIVSNKGKFAHLHCG